MPQHFARSSNISTCFAWRHCLQRCLRRLRRHRCRLGGCSFRGSCNQPPPARLAVLESRRLPRRSSRWHRPRSSLSRRAGQSCPRLARAFSRTTFVRGPALPSRASSRKAAKLCPTRTSPLWSPYTALLARFYAAFFLIRLWGASSCASCAALRSGESPTCGMFGGVQHWAGALPTNGAVKPRPARHGAHRLTGPQRAYGPALPGARG